MTGNAARGNFSSALLPGGALTPGTLNKSVVNLASKPGGGDQITSSNQIAPNRYSIVGGASQASNLGGPQPLPNSTMPAPVGRRLD